MFRIAKLVTHTLIVGFGLFFALAVATAEEGSGVLGGSSNNEHSAEGFLREWNHAVSEVERADFEFVRHVYDTAFETDTVSMGRLVCDSGERVYFELRPPSGKAETGRRGRDGRLFEVRPGSKECWVINGANVMVVDEGRQGKIVFSVAGTSSRPKVLMPLDSVDSVFLWFNGHLDSAIMSDMTLVRLGSAIQGEMSSIPGLNRELQARFQITVAKVTQHHVTLKLIPKAAQEKAMFQQIDVQLSRDTWLPAALRHRDPAGTRETVYIFSNRRVNFCPDEVHDLFDPDFSGCLIQTTSF